MNGCLITFEIRLNGGLVIFRQARDLATVRRYAQQAFGDNVQHVEAIDATEVAA
jgi:hypothetical protein